MASKEITSCVAADPSTLICSHSPTPLQSSSGPSSTTRPSSPGSASLSVSSQNTHSSSSPAQTCASGTSRTSSPTSTPASSEHTLPVSQSRSKMVSVLRAISLQHVCVIILTVVGVVWAVKSYRETTRANKLAMMESCRAHPVYPPNPASCLLAEHELVQYRLTKHHSLSSHAGFA